MDLDRIVASTIKKSLNEHMSTICPELNDVKLAFTIYQVLSYTKNAMEYLIHRHADQVSNQLEGIRVAGFTRQLSRC
jgi:hypothetical protein